MKKSNLILLEASANKINRINSKSKQRQRLFLFLFFFFFFDLFCFFIAVLTGRVNFNYFIERANEWNGMKRNETEWNGNEPLFTFVAGSVFARALLNKRQSTRKRIESNNNRNDKKEPNHISRDIPRSTQLFLPIPFRLSHCFSPSFFLCFDLSVSWSLGLSVSGSRSELVLSFFLFFFFARFSLFCCCCCCWTRVQRSNWNGRLTGFPVPPATVHTSAVPCALLHNIMLQLDYQSETQ